MVQAVRGTIHDNPWAGVEPEHSPPGDFNDEENETTAQQRQRRLIILHEGFWLQALDLLIQVLLCLDAGIGVFNVIFALVLHHKHAQESSHAVLWLLVAGGALLVRAALVTLGLALSTDSLASCQRGGLTLAGYVSVALAVFYALNVVVGLVFHEKVLDYLQTRPLDLTSSQVQVLVSHYSWCIIFLAVCAVLEAIKLPLYRIYRRSVLHWEEEQERMEQLDLIRREAATGRPWWWSSPSQHGRGRGRRGGNNNASLDTSLTESLLDNERPRQRGFFGRLFSSSSRRRRDDNNALSRDDGSVDFASVQEEWASRASEDPVWWSREDGDDDPGSTIAMSNSNNIINREVDTSWANDVTQV